MNGRDHRNAKVEKLLAPQWLEIAHTKWPDGRFDYFLAQMRSPGQDRYIPTLFWGIAPVDPAKVMPPPAPSYVAPERGFAFLRANQSPSYWESSEPAVALQFATLYVHYVSDCFSLLGYHAFNRPLYVNRAISAGYNGGPYDFHVPSHCGVVVDSLQAQPIGPVPHRSDFQEPTKYVHIHTAPPVNPYTGREVRSTDQPKTAALQVYTGVDMSRTLVLTRDYLSDVFWLTSDKPRLYHWLVHPLGDALPALVARAAARQVVITDIRGHWAQSWISAVVRAGIMDTLPNYEFDPGTVVRRGDLARTVSRVLALIAGVRPGSSKKWESARLTISDVAPGHLSYPAVSVAVASGVMSLEGGAFRLLDPVSGAEAVGIIARLEALAR